MIVFLLTANVLEILQMQIGYGLTVAGEFEISFHAKSPGMVRRKAV